MENRKIPENLPAVEFVDTDTDTLVQRLVAGYEGLTGRTLYPADPIRAFILWMASIIIQERVLINESAKQNMPRFATGENLDSVSEIFHNVARLPAKKARVMLRFKLSTPAREQMIIAEGLEATVDGEINFVTLDRLLFTQGEDTAEVEAECLTAGVIGNGFQPGQINRLISREFLYFSSVENSTVSTGGSEIESDEAFYNRMRESEETYTTAGPRESYRYHAKTVSSIISDVSAESSEPGVADIRIMTQGGKLPDAELLREVEEYLSADDVRPMTDIVRVSAPETIPFKIKATYYISSVKEASTKDIRAAVDLAIENYIIWQTQKMGRDINPSYLSVVLMDTGIKRVEIAEPVFTDIPRGSVAVCTGHTVTFGGVEDD